MIQNTRGKVSPMKKKERAALSGAARKREGLVAS